LEAQLDTFLADTFVFPKAVMFHRTKI